jgi:hypothetical protein
MIIFFMATTIYYYYPLACAVPACHIHVQTLIDKITQDNASTRLNHGCANYV